MENMTGMFLYLNEDLQEMASKMYPVELVDLINSRVKSGIYTYKFPNVCDSETGEVVAIYRKQTMCHYYNRATTHMGRTL